MSHPAYMPITPEGRLIRLVEECGEVTQAACKLMRWGNRRWPNENSDSNYEIMERELEDLLEVIDLVRSDYQCGLYSAMFPLVKEIPHAN